VQPVEYEKNELETTYDKGTYESRLPDETIKRRDVGESKLCLNFKKKKEEAGDRWVGDQTWPVKQLSAQLCQVEPLICK
jgi:hypothetical protein